VLVYDTQCTYVHPTQCVLWIHIIPREYSGGGVLNRSFRSSTNCRVFLGVFFVNTDPTVPYVWRAKSNPLIFFFADPFFSCGVVRFFFSTLFLYTSCNENYFTPNFGPLIVDCFSVSRFVVANYPFCIVHSCSGAHHCCNRFLTFISRT
jgi:hypothetical protein